MERRSRRKDGIASQVGWVAAWEKEATDRIPSTPGPVCLSNGSLKLGIRDPFFFSRLRQKTDGRLDK